MEEEDFDLSSVLSTSKWSPVSLRPHRRTVFFHQLAHNQSFTDMNIYRVSMLDEAKSRFELAVVIFRFVSGGKDFRKNKRRRCVNVQLGG